MKTIESIDATTGANQRNSQPQRESQSLPNEALDVEPGSSWSKTAQGTLCSHLIAAEFQQMLEASRRRANDSRAHSDFDRVIGSPRLIPTQEHGYRLAYHLYLPFLKGV